jgi:dTDP-4-dehydrorhamnose reductase
MNRILLIGTNGQLGNALLRRATNSTCRNVPFTKSEQNDESPRGVRD